ncbi:MAG: GNAT family N-acetyltransferase [Candidatus Paceibacterota bacterium]
MEKIQEKSIISMRRFQEPDAGEVSELIKKTLTETNSKNYPKAVISHLVAHVTPKQIVKLSHSLYRIVLTEGDGIVATGAYEKKLFRRGMIKALYIMPTYQGYGLGRQIVKHLEQIAREENVRTMKLEASLWCSGVLY